MLSYDEIASIVVGISSSEDIKSYDYFNFITIDKPQDDGKVYICLVKLDGAKDTFEMDDANRWVWGGGTSIKSSCIEILINASVLSTHSMLFSRVDHPEIFSTLDDMLAMEMI